MAIRWTSALSVGVAAIDDQHKELFERVNQLIEACNQGKGKEVVGQVLDFLADYVKVHFRDEEALMQKYDYPEFENHKAVHQRFIEDFGQLKEKLDREGPGLSLVLQTNRLVVNWLTAHIHRMDKAVGNHIKGKI